MKAIVDAEQFSPLFSAAEARKTRSTPLATRGHGTSLATRIEDLDGKSLACLGKASRPSGRPLDKTSL
jgi:hypothetical protein